MTTTNPPHRTRPRPDRGAQPRRTGWHRIVNRSSIGWTIVGLFIVVVALFAVGYLTTTIPSANSVATAQTTVITYADGKTEIGRIGAQNRINVPLSAVPVEVQHAVLAAEDRNYYNEPGISLHGIARALWANVRGGEISQGGSTITQQYAKNAFLTEQRTLSRKVREVFIAIKLDRTRSKDRILGDYLNAIYFGRGAYGIQTASETYFGKPVSKLTVAQGAVLAAAIRAPSLYDPRQHRAAAVARWHYVIDGMVAQGWLARSDAAGLTYPKVKKPTSADTFGGTDGYVMAAVRHELNQDGFDDDRIATGGYRVVTTIDPKMQQAAVRAEHDILGDRKEPVSGLAAVQPGTGRVLAMYGGRDYTGKQPAAQINLAMNQRPAGSSFKPYTLATALKQGVSLRTDYQGTSPLVVNGWGSAGNVVHNDSNEQCGRCDLVQATALSINTIFAQLAVQVGPSNIAKTAHAAGVSAPLAGADGHTVPSITLGVYGVSALDQADGYATFANKGVHVEPHLVARVLNSHGRPVFTPQPERNRAFSADVAADATYAMTKVVQYGTGTRAALSGRPAAGKTGTTSNNTDAWFVGFTPQVAAAVWLGNVDNKPLTNVPGYSTGIYGGQLPAQIWKAFMDAALQGEPVKDFPAPVFGGGTSTGLPPPPPPTTAPSPSALASGSTAPSPSASSSPSASASRSPSSPASRSRSPLPLRSTRPAGSPSPAPAGSPSRS